MHRDTEDRHREYDGRHPAPTGPEGLSVWATAQSTGPVQRRGRYVPESVKHPARMLPAIAAHAVAAYTNPGDLVLDPMCGIGTTLVEAIHAGRDAIGVEYESRWSDIADANTTHAQGQGATGRAAVMRGDATRILSLVPAALAGQVALVVTSPPYGPTVHGLVRPGADGVAKFDNAYNDGTDRGNLAYRDLTGLADGFAQILAGCHTLLRPGGVVVVTARPWRKHGQLVDLPSAVIGAGIRAGLTPVDRCVALLAAVRDGHLVARPSFFQLQQVRRARTAGTPMHLIAHEDVLVFAKTQKSASSAEPKCSHGESGCPEGTSCHADTGVHGNSGRRSA
ncbi:DNA methyltransferase [Micromonospora sp. 4G57]|uniref:Methyltransferase n=2 Tax=Micromonosporaceae TaxID=28056 RepID=A0ABU5JLH6_9ACTN|nr:MULTISPECIES: DNA methyltransferase [unclassified Micromonospora]MDZ5446742.1 DNA methyltransferase [Micromonospora sp. 4G57]MDZ5493477.1 DNA methyltransferase [Micromonospora sp. 4G53]